MNKFIELTSASSGGKILVAVDKIVFVDWLGDKSYIALRSDRTGKGTFGLHVSEGYEKIKCMLTDIFEDLKS